MFVRHQSGALIASLENRTGERDFTPGQSRTRSLNAFRMTELEMRRFCEMLAEWRPPYLFGYASALHEFARFVEAETKEHLRFRAIRSSAEILSAEYRNTIQRIFQSPVYNFYGSREINNLAAECAEYRRLHLISTWRYVEITDEEGKPVPNGRPGYITVTECSNRAMPLIRYRNDDVGILSHDQCPCGRPTPILEELLGRSTDIIRTGSGKMIHGEYFTHLFYGRNDIDAFQVHQTALDHLVLRYVAPRPTAHAFVDAIRSTIETEFSTPARVEIEPCDTIPVTRSGKHRFTISDL